MKIKAIVTCAVLGLAFGFAFFSIVGTLQAIGFEQAMEVGAMWVGLLFVTGVAGITLCLSAILGFVFYGEEY